MPVTSLSDVTSSLETLFKENIEERLSNAVTVNTSTVAPADVNAANNLINIFLFHFHPDGKPTVYENQAITPPQPASFSKPVTLYYHLTAYHNSATNAHLTEQDLLGHAMATLLDHTEVNDDLTVGGVPVLETALLDEDNAFELEVLSKSDTEALNVWAAHETSDLRLSIYFKVKNVRLQPQAPQSFAGPILSIGNLVVPNMGPRIASIHSTITATLPMDSGPVARQFRRHPAELYLGAPVTDRQITLLGSSLDQFAAVDLTVPVGADSEVIRIDFDANAAGGWAIAPTTGGITIEWDADLERPVSGVPTVLPLEPGSAQIKLAKTEYITRDDARVPIEIRSNSVAITLHPFIAGIAPMAARRFRIDLNGGYDLTTMAGPSDHASLLRLAVGGTVYEVIDDDAALAAGQIAISGVRSLDFILTSDVDETALAFVQLWVRDAVSQPFWIGG